MEEEEGDAEREGEEEEEEFERRERSLSLRVSNFSPVLAIRMRPHPLVECPLIAFVHAVGVGNCFSPVCISSLS